VLTLSRAMSCVVPDNPESAFPEPEFPVLGSSGRTPGGSGKTELACA
jgi:hypothetical protein